MKTTRKTATKARRKKAASAKASTRLGRATSMTGLAEVQHIVAQLRDMSAEATAKTSVDQLMAMFYDQFLVQNDPPGDGDDAILARANGLLRINQALRRTNGDPDCRLFHGAALLCIGIAGMEWMHDRASDALWSKMEAIKVREGLLEDDDWDEGEGPADYQALYTEFFTLYDRFLTDTMRRLGEAEMAALYANNRAEYDRLYELGSQAVHGSIPDALLPGLPK